MRLRQARELATMLVGADPTAKPVVHPLRWPGSWNCKATPRLSTIAAYDATAEINLSEALEALETAIEAAGWASADMPGEPATPEADIAVVQSAMAMIPNVADDVHYGMWVRLGYAVHRATGGTAEGFGVWDTWSKTSDKYDADETFPDVAAHPGAALSGKNPPRTIGAGTIFYLAAQHGWIRQPPLFEHSQARARESEADPEPESRKPPEEPFPATPFVAAEVLNIPPRQWVYGRFLIRRFLAVLGAPGGAGKTAYAMAVAACVALNRDLLGEGVHEAGNVWLYNLEDPRDELLRRVAALALHHAIEPAELEGRLFLDSGRDRPLIIAEVSDGVTVAMPVVDDLISELKRRNIRLLIVDPFVKSHRLEENRNEQIDFATSLLEQGSRRGGLRRPAAASLPQRRCQRRSGKLSVARRR